jgi:outer membrane lipoprotein-sorting protein
MHHKFENAAGRAIAPTMGRRRREGNPLLRSLLAFNLAHRRTKAKKFRTLNPPRSGYSAGRCPLFRMINLSRLLFLITLSALPALPVSADSLPDPATKKDVKPIPLIQARIYTRLNLADFTLTGKVRSDKTHASYPITIHTKKHIIVYEFNDQPLQLRIQLDPGAFTLERRTSSTASWAPVPLSQFDQPILGTDITYGDLDLDFVNWDDVEALGTDSIKTLPAYVLEAHPGPKDHSAFAAVRFWVSTQYWALLRIDGLNAQGQTVKRVEVQDVMTIGDNNKYTVFKEMKISTMEPDKNDIARSTTYIDVDSGKEGSGL